MEAWRKVWRAGVHLLPTRGLQALKVALETDDERLLQGATTTPPPLQCVQDWPCEAACRVGFCGWQADDDPTTTTVAEAEEFFAQWCFAVDEALQEPAACRWLLNAFDEWPRQEMRAALLPEVELALVGRRET